ncbi:MAG: GNAT family N-acetyltransferase [Candidatus Thermoplasmatota archaeon]|nr:GNAT family N-acetyltransferase [Candidatus Thermoplasmatota archaeon]MEC8680862.1 GNAT family N-acetyltransferase [Candidatus Thermoplasmatota archaeon]
MNIRHLTHADVEAMWVINEEGLPGTGRVSPSELTALLDLASLSLGAFDAQHMLGFVICLPPQTTYGSLNYAWFNQRYDAFLYVDRIAVATDHRNRGVGSALYSQVIAEANEQAVPVAAEVNLVPPNPGSVRFHHRFNFVEVGTLDHGEKAVTMFLC